MEMRKCPSGHYYDASIHSSCPYCSNASDAGATLPLESFMSASSGDNSATMPFGYKPAGDDGKTVSINSAMNSFDSDDGRTVALVRQDKGIDPVVGWLVCIDGPEKGRDYKIHTDNNYIGRSERMDICIHGDETISRENHAVISYDMQDAVFYLSPGDGRAIVRYNNKAVFSTITLNPYDQITIGKSILLFVPLCGEKFVW